MLYNYDHKTDELSMYLSEFIPADKLVFSDSDSNSTDDTATKAVMVQLVRKMTSGSAYLKLSTLSEVKNT